MIKLNKTKDKKFIHQLLCAKWARAVEGYKELAMTMLNNINNLSTEVKTLGRIVLQKIDHKE